MSPLQLRIAGSTPASCSSETLRLELSRFSRQPGWTAAGEKLMLALLLLFTASELVPRPEQADASDASYAASATTAGLHDLHVPWLHASREHGNGGAESNGQGPSLKTAGQRDFGPLIVGSVRAEGTDRGETMRDLSASVHPDRTHAPPLL